MAIKLTKLTTFDTPEGDYRATVRDAFEKKDGTFRLVFEITSLNHRLHDYLAGKNYLPGKPELTSDLADWLGKEQMEQLLKEDGTLDIEKLKGLEADVQIVHIKNEEHPRPFVYISKIEPVGTLTEAISSGAN